MDLSKTPASPPPPGVVPNFENPESIASQVYEISLPFTIFATIIVALRLYGRIHIVKSPGLDDLFIVLAMILSWVFCALGIANLPYGYGKHLWELYVPEVITFLKIDLAGQDFYFAGTCFVKVSIALMYLRLNPSQTFRYWTWGIIAFDTLYSLAGVIVATFGCTPIEGGWDITIEAKCVDKKAFYYVAAVCNIVSDFATMALALRMVWKLQMQRKQRIWLVLLFTVGSFACIVSIIRVVTMLPTLKSTDFTWFKVQVAAWAEVEINIGIVCACLPCMKPILSRHFPYLINSSPRGTRSASGTASNSYGLRLFSKNRSTSQKVPSWPGDVEYSANIQSKSATERADESDSMREILKGQRENGNDKSIVRTQEYEVDYGSDRNAGSEWS
ncbi:hypothetical protein VTN77DRAFT_4602 [Rasamsonia byssochlamydoides]|uniref:uncharacterized protein n=1 Tax=Rasamsonia byssochlamydoides TaxID=89139 RepID=UPI003743CFDC